MPAKIAGCPGSVWARGSANGGGLLVSAKFFTAGAAEQARVVVHSEVRHREAPVFTSGAKDLASSVTVDSREILRSA